MVVQRGCDVKDPINAFDSLVETSLLCDDHIRVQHDIPLKVIPKAYLLEVLNNDIVKSIPCIAKYTFEVLALLLGSDSSTNPETALQEDVDSMGRDEARPIAG